MTSKKTKSADLERKRFAFFQVGLIVALALTLLAFEYSEAHAAERMVDLDLPEEPLVVFNPTDIPIEDQPQQASQIQAPPNPGIQMIEDTVEIVKGPVEPGKGIYVPPSGIHIDPIPLPPDDPPLPPVPPIDPITDDWTREPQFPGGLAAMNKFILDHISYPQNAVDTETEGTVYVEFVINRDGSICDVTAKNKLNPELEREAVRVVSIMPKWTPGEQMGKTVRVRYLIPIKFTLD